MKRPVTQFQNGKQFSLPCFLFVVKPFNLGPLICYKKSFKVLLSQFEVQVEASFLFHA